MSKNFLAILEEQTDANARELLAVAMSTYCAACERDALEAVRRLRELSEAIPQEYRPQVMEGEQYFKKQAGELSAAAKHFAAEAVRVRLAFNRAETEAAQATKH